MIFELLRVCYFVELFYIMLLAVYVHVLSIGQGLNSLIKGGFNI